MDLKEILKECADCDKQDCPLRVIATYLNQIGCEHFYHLYNKNKLPKEIRLAVVQCILGSCFL